MATDQANPTDQPFADASFPVFGRRIAGRRWRQGARQPALALHGWRDNCASFDRLAPHLPDSDIVALDMPGHALSDDRSRDAPYTIWQDVGELLAVADQLGWRQFDLIGHSRGATVSMLLAASHPHRVRRLVLIDGLFPLPATTAEAAGVLAKAIADNERLVARPPRYHASFESAVAARLKGPLALTEDAAVVLARRGVAEGPHGWYWRLDPRLGGASEVRLSLEYGEAFVRALACPTLLLMGEDSFFPELAHIRHLAVLNPVIERHRVPGGHHCHMDAGVGAIVRLARDFLAG